MTEKKKPEKNSTAEKMEHAAAVVGDLGKLYVREQAPGRAMATVFAHTRQLSEEELRFALSVAVAWGTEGRRELVSLVSGPDADPPVLH